MDFWCERGRVEKLGYGWVGGGGLILLEKQFLTSFMLSTLKKQLKEINVKNNSLNLNSLLALTNIDIEPIKTSFYAFYV